MFPVLHVTGFIDTLQPGQPHLAYEIKVITHTLDPPQFHPWVCTFVLLLLCDPDWFLQAYSTFATVVVAPTQHGRAMVVLQCLS